MLRSARILVAALLIGAGFVGVGPALAEDKPVEVTRSSTMREVVAGNVGKRVTLRMDGGETIEGTVTLVGEQLVHVSKLAGRDFFDAVVRLDKVQSVTFRAR